MSKYIVLLTAISLCLCIQAEGQGNFSVMAWNVENVFDTLHDAGKLDEEFLPEGSHRWTRYRLFRKLKAIGKTIVAVDSVQPIDVIGLCEVENDTVMTCLTERTQLRKLGYHYIMTHSEDERGIDVALLMPPCGSGCLAMKVCEPRPARPCAMFCTPQD